MLYATPCTSAAVLMLNPSRTIVTDTTRLNGLGVGGNKWRGIAFAPSVDMMFAAPSNADAVLMINPHTNVTGVTTLGGLGTDFDKWIGIAYASSVDMLFAAPYLAEAVLMINPHTNVTGYHHARWARGRHWEVARLFLRPVYGHALCSTSQRTMRFRSHG
jgi:hypothetical protein